MRIDKQWGYIGGLFFRSKQYWAADLLLAEELGRSIVRLTVTRSEARHSHPASKVEVTTQTAKYKDILKGLKYVCSES